MNYNYGRYLTEAVESVFAQIYPNIECLLVDNASTDGSLQIIDSLVAEHPSIKTLLRAANDGQCLASAEGFALSTGQYVVFLDADDVMMPDFVSTHIFTHLSLRTHVGFTCSDMFQTMDRSIVLSTLFTMNDFILNEPKNSGPLLRPIEAASPMWLAGAMTPIDESKLYFYDRKRTGWPWAATSAFVFRRDALDLIIDNSRFDIVKGPLDVYLARGINIFTGSVIIDKPMTIYRLHGTNIFSRHAHLNRFINFERGGVFDKEAAVRRELIDYIILNAELFLAKLESRDEFVDAIVALSEAWPRLAVPSHRYSYGGEQVLANAAKLGPLVGTATLSRWCMRLRIPVLKVAVGFLGRRHPK